MKFASHGMSPTVEQGKCDERGVAEAMCDGVTTSQPHSHPPGMVPPGEEVEKIWSEAERREEHKEGGYRFVLISHFSNPFDCQ